MPHALLIRRIAILALATGLSLCIALPGGAAAAPPHGEGQREEMARAMRAGGGYEGRPHRPRATMDSGVHGGPELSTIGGALIAIASAAIGAGVAVLLMRRRRGPPQSVAR
jgi:hypothetical protein